MKLQPECISQIAEIIFQTRSNVQAKTMYQERRWRNEEGSNFRTCRYSSIGFRCVWKKCCNGKQFRFGCFNGIGILAGGKWTESNPCEPGNKFVSGVTEKYHIRWREQLGRGHIIRRRIIRRHIIQTRIMIENGRGLLNIREQKQTKGYPKRIPLFYLSGKQYNAILNMNLTRKARQVQKKTAGICQYTRTCAAGNSGRMEKRK